MLDFVLVSVAVVAVIAFLVNVRSLRGQGELPALDGNPHWERGELTSLKATGKYLGATTAKLVFTMQERDHELSGLIPPSFESQIKAGLAVEGHVEYDLLDTVRTDFWDPSPFAVLSDVALRLGSSSSPSSQAPHTLQIDREGRVLEVCLADDGWLMLTYTVADRQEISVDLRADFDVAENAHMLTERLGIMPDHSEHAEALARLSPTTLQRLEDFITLAYGWICIDHEAIDFECALPFPHAELVVTLIEHVGPLISVVEAELRGETDGAW